MFGTIESVNAKIIEKISYVKSGLLSLREMSIMLSKIASAHTGRKYIDAVNQLKLLHFNLTIDSIETLEANYNLAIISVLGDYYANAENEEKNTREFYRVITSDNYVSKINNTIASVKTMIATLYKILQLGLLIKHETRELEYQLDDISKNIDSAQNIEITVVLEKRNYEICGCGSKMTIVPELSELHCIGCSKVKTIIGAVFRDDQFYPQDGQKTKHGGYDTTRHYKFWIERLQALESKTFDEKTLTNIEYVIKRDEYDRRALTCENMREILKDPKVSATNLNNHAPLLVKTFGGPPPPQLDFQENKLISIRFNKVMRLYDIVNPESGNKPYYPYFIYKLLEYEFRFKPAKLRLLDYIHLQSRETVIKNDKYFEQMCILSDGSSEVSGLLYTPTDPAGRL